MILRDKVKIIFNRNRETMKHIGEFAWDYFNYFYGELNRDNFIAFISDWSGIERARRKVFKEPNYSLPPELEIIRQEKVIQFREKYKNKEEEMKNFSKLVL